MKPRIGSLKKKSLAIFSKKKNPKIQIRKGGMSDTAKIQRLIRDFFENLFATKQEEMGKFLDPNNLLNG